MMMAWIRCQANSKHSNKENRGGYPAVDGTGILGIQDGSHRIYLCIGFVLACIAGVTRLAADGVRTLERHMVAGVGGWPSSMGCLLESDSGGGCLCDVNLNDIAFSSKEW